MIFLIMAPSQKLVLAPRATIGDNTVFSYLGNEGFLTGDIMQNQSLLNTTTTRLTMFQKCISMRVATRNF